MRYAYARYELFQREQAYRIYVSDAFYLQGQNKYNTRRYSDMIIPKTTVEDPRTGEQIVVDVIKRANLKFGGK